MYSLLINRPRYQRPVLEGGRGMKENKISRIDATIHINLSRLQKNIKLTYIPYWVPTYN